MVVTPDNATLIVAESYGKKLTAFDIAADGGLSNQRVWADLNGGVPDGICVDAEDAVWYGDVPNKRCVRVREGGEVLETIELDRGCFACKLGGADKRTLFLVATEWGGTERVGDGTRTGQLLTVEAPAPGAGWPQDLRAAVRAPRRRNGQEPIARRRASPLPVSSSRRGRRGGRWCAARLGLGQAVVQAAKR
jgi:sugar lactone lactonase YvrE